MLVFLLRRLFSVVVVLVAVTAVVFSVFYALRPEDVADGTGYFHQLSGYLDRAFLHADLGRSFDFRTGNRPVMTLLRQGFPADFWLVLGGMVSGTVIGVAAGAASVRRRNRLVRAGLNAFAAFGMAAPVYWVGAMAVVFFHPEVGRIARLPISKPNTYVPLAKDPGAWFGSLWLPCLILGLPLAAIVMRMMRASLLETFEEDFVRTARGKGLTSRAVMRHHAVPAASAPVISLVGVTVGTVITNAVLLEQTFSIPGIFSLMTRALGQADLPIIQGVAIAGALLVVASNLLADVAQAWLDPRVRSGAIRR
ncbi:MAG: peptide/nickel transport system permease protein [Solirubrobacteraceae bacterium]|nr:peptide/nickel transport system permease protein [Solirubrobacteraceae bacterium]